MQQTASARVGILRQRPVLIHAVVLTAVALALHWVWEKLQCEPFFILKSEMPMELAMLQATLGDLGLTWLAQGVVALATGRWLWAAEQWTARAWVALLCTALGLSIGIELWALSTERWAYTDLAPLLPGTPVSLVPVVQLLVLFPLSFAIAGRAARSRTPESS